MFRLVIWTVIVFRVPKDEESVRKWKTALNLSQDILLRGMICFDHFDSNDVIKGSAKREMRLKKHAVPFLLEAAEAAEGVESKSSANSIELADQAEQIKDKPPQKCINCDVLKAEMGQLQNDYTKMELNYNSFLCDMKLKLDTQVKNSKLMKRKLDYAKSTKTKLGATLKQLKEENTLCKDVVDFVEVSLSFFIFFRVNRIQ